MKCHRLAFHWDTGICGWNGRIAISLIIDPITCQAQRSSLCSSNVGIRAKLGSNKAPSCLISFRTRGRGKVLDQAGGQMSVRGTRQRAVIFLLRYLGI